MKNFGSQAISGNMCNLNFYSQEKTEIPEGKW